MAKRQKRQRWTTKSYTLAYKMLAYRDGEKCDLSGRPFGAPTTKVEQKHGMGDTVILEIDEIDGNPGNHADWNLRLLSRTCNLALGCGWAAGGGGDMRVVCESVCKKPCVAMLRREKTTRGARRGDSAEESLKRMEKERSEGQSSTRLAKENVDYSAGPPEMQAAGIFEVNFRRYVLEEVREKRIVSYKDAATGGAEKVGCSVITGQRYLEKLTGPLGPLQIVTDSAGQKQLTWKQRLSEE
jgi:hypothetical protein